MPADFESCTRTFHGIRDRRKRDQNAQSAVAGNQVLEEPVDGTRHIRERAGLFGKPDQKGIIEEEFLLLFSIFILDDNDLVRTRQQDGHGPAVLLYPSADQVLAFPSLTHPRFGLDSPLAMIPENFDSCPFAATFLAFLRIASPSCGFTGSFAKRWRKNQ